MKYDEQTSLIPAICNLSMSIIFAHCFFRHVIDLKTTRCSFLYFIFFQVFARQNRWQKDISRKANEIEKGKNKMQFLCYLVVDTMDLLATICSIDNSSKVWCSHVDSKMTKQLCPHFCNTNALHTRTHTSWLP